MTRSTLNIAASLAVWVKSPRRPATRAIVFALALLTLATAGAARQLAAADTTTDGSWSTPVSWPLVAVHMSLEPTGQVVVLDGFDAGPNSERLWDPQTGTFTPIPYGRNLFCSGHVQLADGRTLFVGGHVAANDGLADTTIFNPVTKTWFRGPDMSVGRWYPTATQLPDGRVLAFAGDNIVQDRPGAAPPLSDASVNSLPSVYDPNTNAWTDLTSARLTSPLYPFMFVLSNGKLFDAGPDTTTRILDPATWTWSTVGTSPIDGHSAVMYRPNKIMKSGTWADPDFNGSRAFNSDGRTAVIDMSAPTPQWRQTASMANARSYHNLTLLPDGTVLASGGGTRSDGVDITNAVLPTEIWNPTTETWTTVAPLHNGRLYHSTALLLPDGRVLMAGGGQLPNSIAVNQTNAEIYSPPYLFKGARPTITAPFPASATYGATFDVNTPDAAQVTSVSLIRSPSVTHAFDENQRFQFLNFTAGAGKVTVQAPANANLAPPGDYMLFLLNGSGVPSVGRFVRIAAAADTTAPTVAVTAPAGGATVANTVSVTANAGDDTGVVGVQFKLDGANLGIEDSSAPYSISWDTRLIANGSHTLTAVARDAAGNTTTSAGVSVIVSNSGASPNLVAAYGFDEGSGSTAADSSGANNNGTITGATWAAVGKFGAALSFDGGDVVNVPDSSSLDLTTAMTLEAWVRPTTLGTSWRTVVFKEQPAYYAYSLYASTGTGVPSGNAMIAGTDRDVRAASALTANTWTHLAATYDGAVLRIYVNGVQSAQLLAVGSIATSNGALKIGGNSIWPEDFQGLIDEVRIYSRALSQAEIQADLNASVGNPDTQPPTAPTGLGAIGSLSSVALSWTAATDNTGVARYNVHRSTSPGFTASAANRIAQPSATSYTDAGLAAGTYYYKVIAEDAAGNASPSSNEASAIVTGDVVAPTGPASLTATASPGSVGLSWPTATDNVAVTRYNVHRSTSAGFTPTAANRIAQPTGTTYTDPGLAAGTYYYRVIAEDAAGNLGAASPQASATVTTAPPTGLVAAYSFDQGSGTVLADHSGNGNTGAINGATWIGAGKYGGALSFDGVNDIVNIADANSLDLTTAMTLEAWVRPTALGTNWRTVLLKEQAGNYVYGLYGNTGTSRPSANVISGGVDRDLRGASALTTNTWSHLAATYNGSTLTLYLNGVSIGTQAGTGSIATSTGALRLGGNTIWPEWFQGDIDEVRIYNRALTAGEIQTDMNASVGNPDAVAPTPPGALTPSAGITSVNLSWTASTDNVGVTRYNVHRSTTPGFTPGAANLIATPASPGHLDAGLSPGTYYYRVTAQDAAGNVSAASNEAAATVTGDITAPSAPTSLVATGSLSSVALSWAASTDNVGVTRYNVHRSTSPGFTPAAGNRIAQPTGASYTDTGLAAGTYYYVVIAEDAAGNLSPPSTETSVVVTGDIVAPSTPATLNATGGVSNVGLSWSAATDNVAVTRYNLHRSATAGFTPSAANRIAQPTGTSYTDAALPAGTYYYRVTAEDAAGNVGSPSPQASAVVTGDITAPTTPTGLTATGSSTSVALAWTASTDNVGVTRYNVHRSTTAGFTPSAANRIAQPAGTSYTDSALSPGTYYYRVIAEDAAGNVSAASAEVAGTVSAAPPTGLVAAYAMDENGGTSIADKAGTNVGTLSGPTWATGKFGSALSFDGVNDIVNIADAATLDLATAMTLEAWVRPTALGSEWRTVVLKEQPGNYVYTLYGNTGTSRPSGNVIAGGVDRDLRGSAQLALNAWQHLATTYDGTTLRLYVDGVLAGSQAATGAIATSSGALRIGGNAIWGEYFAGLIDEVRIYNRSLTQAEIQSDMTQSIGTPDTVAPGAPPTLTASGSIGVISLSWGAASDNIGVARYNLHRGTTPGFTPTTANRIAQQPGTTYVDSGLATGTYYYRVSAEDAAGNIGPFSVEASAAATADTIAPSVPANVNATAGAGQASLSWTASTDNVGVVRYDVHRSTTSGFTPAVGNRIAQPTTASYVDTGLAAGTYYYKVVAADANGNLSAPSAQVSAVITAAPPVGLVASYGFDEGSGTTAADSSGSGNGGTVSGATWAIGKFGTALSFDGINDIVNVADSASLDLTTGMTIEAWVLPRALGTAWRTVVLKEQPGNYAYGLYGNTGTGRPSANIISGAADHDLRGPASLPLDTWVHVAATYDAANLRLYVNGSLAASVAATGSISTSTGALRIGGNNIWAGEFFQGRIDEVRIYNRALTQGQIQSDMASPAATDTKDPTVVAATPANGAANVTIDTQPTASFSEAIDPSTLTASTFELRDGGGVLVPATIAYDPLAAQATLSPSSALLYNTTYTARIKSGSAGVKDMSGRSLGADYVWAFSLQPSPPPIAVLTSASNPFTGYIGEILRAEGYSFAQLQASLMSPAVLDYFDVVVLGETPLTAAQVTILSNWVAAGGNLIAMKPDKQLAGLLGLSDAGSTLTNGYILVDNATQPGAGIVGQTIQYHGTADRYTLSGATGIAALYSTATAATPNVAVSLRTVGANGGQAAAFTYDLARSIVLTRQGNPAWVGQDRDGVFPIRPNDLFYGAAAGDVQPDWVNTAKLAIPQADEQQRLLSNLIVTMARDRKPLPHFWYLPRGEKAAIVMTGDDHAVGGTAGRFDQYKAASPPGCVVALWECIRSTSYIYTASPLTNTQAAGYVAEGFEVALHGSTTGSTSCENWTPASLESVLTAQLSSFAAKYSSVPATKTHRIHCVTWSDWSTMAKTELAHGIRFDTNYYHHPAAWIGAIPGFMTGSGLIMRFADLDGTPIDVYQAHTHMTDEASQPYPSTVNALLDKAVGPEGYYGVFTVNMHTDQVNSAGSDAIIASAKARSVPVVSAKQMLDWVDGRNASSFSAFSWNGSSLGFTIGVGTTATGLQGMLPLQTGSKTLSSITRNGTAVFFSTETIKGIDYAAFAAAAGTYVATYA